MGWLGRLFRAVPKEEMQGICLNTAEPYWEVDGPKTFREMFNALKGWVPEDAILYFEDGSPDAEIIEFMSTHSVPEVSHVAMGTIWPRPKMFHVPATKGVLTKLAKIMEHHAEPELAIHFHIYHNDTVLLEWHDAFSQPMLISGAIPEKKIIILANKIGENYKRILEQNASAGANELRR
jgi:hypothetical protein